MKIHFVHKFVCLLGVVIAAFGFAVSQDASKPDVTPAGFRIGERLTYNISFQKYDNVGFAEIYAVSHGKLGETDAVELRMKLKTTGLLSAAFYQIDESRTTFANPETGAPLLVKRQDNSSVVIKELVSNYITSPSSGMDLLTLIYRARQAGGSGSFLFVEGDKTYNVTLLQQAVEHLKTDAGEFDTNIANVQSDYLAEHGILSMRVSFSTDEAHVPVVARLKTAKGEFKLTLSGIYNIEPEVEASPTPAVTQTPHPANTPKPTPTPYVDNEPLNPELGFALGEKLTYRVSSGATRIATIVLTAKERKNISRQDSLVLTASVASVEGGSGIFSGTDTIIARVDPETLSPFEVATRTSGPLAALTKILKFDQRTGAITSGNARIDAPIGTHTLLSFLYAMRSFNLNPSRDSRNPVNDTRVAVFWGEKANIFMLRPTDPETITVNGQKFQAQKVAVRTNDQQLDALGLTVWLSTDQSRTPLMIKLGTYQAELIAATKTPVN
jgi:hypothetical protein